MDLPTLLTIGSFFAILIALSIITLYPRCMNYNLTIVHECSYGWIPYKRMRYFLSEDSSRGNLVIVEDTYCINGLRDNERGMWKANMSPRDVSHKFIFEKSMLGYNKNQNCNYLNNTYLSTRNGYYMRPYMRVKSQEVIIY